MKVALCKLDEIPDEGARLMDFFSREILVLKVDGKPKAIMNVCMHLGGPLQRQGDSLVCAWHNAQFALQDGRRVDGPGRPDARLMILPTRIEDDTLYYVYRE